MKKFKIKKVKNDLIGLDSLGNVFKLCKNGSWEQIKIKKLFKLL
jgi:hypothetical protein